ncbi:MAG: cupin domain-containing protein [Actinobacteria bacterium]|nr:MAG: cupin domain-containing protein [Actinomycetota bacterium]
MLAARSGPKRRSSSRPTDQAKHYRWDDLPREDLNPLLSRRLVTGGDMMIAHVYLKQGCIVPKHAHHNEQLTYVLEGCLRFRLGDDGEQVVDVNGGEVLCIPRDLPHEAEALADTLDVDVFNPPREDWLDGSDAYLRRPA